MCRHCIQSRQILIIVQVQLVQQQAILGLLVRRPAACAGLLAHAGEEEAPTSRNSQGIDEAAGGQAAEFPQRSPACSLALQPPEPDDPVTRPAGLCEPHNRIRVETDDHGNSERRFQSRCCAMH